MDTFDHINEARIRYGLKPVRRSRGLKRSAAVMARWLQHHPFAHRDHIYASNRFVWLGEVLATGYQDPRTVVRGWLDSPPHRAILLSPKARKVGVRRVGNTWVAHFGRLGV